MRITNAIWLPDMVDKLAWKHRVTTVEVEHVLAHAARFKFAERGRHHGENVYGAFGQTETGRYLAVRFICKLDHKRLQFLAPDRWMTRRAKAMAINKKHRDPIPREFKTVEELQAFWDTHSVADYDDLFKDVHFDVDLASRTNLVAVEPILMQEHVKRAHATGVSTEALVNLWLSRQLREAT